MEQPSGQYDDGEMKEYWDTEKTCLENPKNPKTGEAWAVTDEITDKMVAYAEACIKWETDNAAYEEYQKGKTLFKLEIAKAIWEQNQKYEAG